MATRTLTANVAYPLWIALHPLTYKVHNKFKTDHTLAAPNLSKKTSIEASVERYKSNTNIKTSSWMLLDTTTLENKASGAQKRASVHKGTQQMTMQLRVNRRTVTIQPLTFKERQQYEHVTVEVGGETQYLNCSSEEQSVWINVIGSWKPVTGEVELYHYEETPALPVAHAMMAKYLTWNIDDKTKQPISPTATS